MILLLNSDLCLLKTVSRREIVMREKDRKQIEEIIGHMQCPKNFKCADSGFEKLCSARDLGLEAFLECLDEDPSHCKFAIIFGDGHFCQCPLRVYLAKALKK